MLTLLSPYLENKVWSENVIRMRGKSMDSSYYKGKKKPRLSSLEATRLDLY